MLKEILESIQKLSDDLTANGYSALAEQAQRLIDKLSELIDSGASCMNKCMEEEEDK